MDRERSHLFERRNALHKQRNALYKFRHELSEKVWQYVRQQTSVEVTHETHRWSPTHTDAIVGISKSTASKVSVSH